MIYDNLCLSYYNLLINLDFNSRIVMVGGDSGIGKSFLYQVIYSNTTQPHYSNIVMINYTSLNVLHLKLIDLLKSYKNKFIVIDNTELLLDNEVKNYIKRDESNQYFLFGRNIDGLNLGAKSQAELIIENNNMYLYYPYLDRINSIVKDFQNGYEFIWP